MKKIFNITVSVLRAIFIFALFAPACEAREGKEGDKRKEKLLATRQAWYDAYSRGDIGKMAQIEANDFLVISESGVQTREQQLSGIKKRVDEHKWMPKGTTHVSDELKVRFYGSSAVISGRGWTKFPEQRDPPKERYELTEVWVSKNATWMVVHLHFNRSERP
jgi:hypothetical protein